MQCTLFGARFFAFEYSSFQSFIDRL